MEARRPQSSTNGRRRRLLAHQETSELLQEFRELSPQTSAPVALRPAGIEPDQRVLQRMVSPQLWKHILLILVLGFLAVTSVWSEISQPPAIRNLATASQPRVSQGLAGLCFFAAGQLALMIGWIRARSSVDFSGRYRCWKWLAGCLISTGALWITNTQDSLPLLAESLAEPLIGSIGAARRTLVVVPIASLSIWVLGRVIPDMGRNRTSQTVFTVGVLAALLRLLMVYSSSLGTCPASILNAVLLTSAGLLVSSLLLHTRFVMYISQDPPQRALSAARTTDQSATPADHQQPATVDFATEAVREETSSENSTVPAINADREMTDGEKSAVVDATNSASTAAPVDSPRTQDAGKRGRRRRKRKAA